MACIVGVPAGEVQYLFSDSGFLVGEAKAGTLVVRDGVVGFVDLAGRTVTAREGERGMYRIRHHGEEPVVGAVERRVRAII